MAQMISFDKYRITYKWVVFMYLQYYNKEL